MLLAAAATVAAATTPADPHDIEVVHVVTMSHLDVGYKYAEIARGALPIIM